MSRTLLIRDDWVADSACRGKAHEVGHGLFFDNKSSLLGKALCANCPVAEECLRFAEKHECTFGVYGGLDAEQRRLFWNRYGSVSTARGHAAHKGELARLRKSIAMSIANAKRNHKRKR